MYVCQDKSHSINNDNEIPSSVLLKQCFVVYIYICACKLHVCYMLCMVCVYVMHGLCCYAHLAKKRLAAMNPTAETTAIADNTYSDLNQAVLMSRGLTTHNSASPFWI